MRLKCESQRQRVLCGHKSVNVEKDRYEMGEKSWGGEGGE